MVKCNSDRKVTVLFQCLLHLRVKRLKKSAARVAELGKKQSEYLLAVKEDLSKSVRLAEDEN